MADNRLKAAAFACCAALALAVPAAAQDKLYLEEYKAYNAALEAGDSAGAAIHARAAWQAAEQELGDNALTAILAYNYGQLVLITDPKSALAALNRAAELRASVGADLPGKELAVYKAYAELALDPKRSRKRDDFRAALLLLEGDEYPASAEIAMMWLRLAAADVENRDYENGMASAARAETTFFAVEPTAHRRRAEALLLLGIATMFHNGSHPDDILAANQHFIEAGMLFPAQKDIQSFDRTLALILAWNNTAWAWLQSEAAYQAEPETYTGSRIQIAIPEKYKADPTKFSPFDYEAVFPAAKSSEACNIEWEEREPPQYPVRAFMSGYVGTALVGYNLSAELEVVDPIILAEVPGEVFGEAAVKSMAKWKVATAPDKGPACMKNRLTVFTFVMKPG